MTNITINQLNILGYELFNDSESFLDGLNSKEILSLEGGFYSTPSGLSAGYSGFGSYGGFGGFGTYGGYGGYGFGYNSFC
ncbi:hypothetical protein ACX27_09580 [Nostoc piscinale CENA21]|uniref:Uncharacterized protein n=1 Tax=Nostoc piscinale CENA21 TaxID=224013 RepID=A0A0M4SQS1_9NOSO|nr:hypothetical protein [Nostoc piscinale]ALF53040.1 hypothetical protein ACX27_09580 [Nostoc piscinale CENA21]